MRLSWLFLLLFVALAAGCIAGGNSKINPLPSGMQEKLLFTTFNSETKSAELYLVDSSGAKLLVSKKSPNEFMQKIYAKVSPKKDRIAYRYTIKGEDYDVGYDNPAYPGLEYTPYSSIYLSGIDGAGETILVRAGEKEDIPRFVWSDDGKYLFYNVVDYSVQSRGEADKVLVSVFRVDVDSKERLMLYRSVEDVRDIVNLYIIGYFPGEKKVLVSYGTETRASINTECAWGIYGINAFPPQAFFGPIHSVAGNLGVAASPPALLDGRWVAYMISGDGCATYTDSEKATIFDLNTRQKTELMDGKQISRIHGVNSKQFIATEYDEKKNKFREYLVDAKGTAISIDSSPTSVSPKSGVYLFSGDGILLVDPKTNKNTRIMSAKSWFVGWVE